MAVNSLEATKGTSVSTQISNCRSCYSGELSEVLDLGKMYLAGFSLDGRPPISAPLNLVMCGNCNLVQLKDTTDPRLLYQEWYGYRSSVNEHMVADLESITSTAEKIVNLRAGDIVLDIGCNDGTLLSKYRTPGIYRVGFDPARNVAQYAPGTLEPYGVDKFTIFFDFFSKEPFRRRYEGQKARVVTAISMFYDLNDPNTFLQDVRDVLDPEGVFVVQQNYLAGMLRQRAFDNICHEHLEYYSLSSMAHLLDRNGLEVFDVQVSDINGGSFRTYIRHSGAGVGVEGGEDRVSDMLSNEKEIGLLERDTYTEFADDVKRGSERLTGFVKDKVAKGGRVYAYAASTRGNTLLQYAGLDGKLLAKAAERNPDKVGRKTVGTGIPIVSEEEARADNPDYFLVLPWFLRDTFIQRERAYLEGGGKMIFPLPKPEIVSIVNGEVVVTQIK